MPTIMHHHFQRLLVCVVSLVMIALLAACAGVSNTPGTNTAGTTSLTGTVVSVNAAQHSAVLTVNGQQVTVSGLTDQQVAALQAQVGKVYTLQVTGSGNSYTIVPNSTLQPGETQTPGSNTTQSPTTPAPGSIQFTGTVRSISSTSTVVSMPDGSTLTMSITSLTDRSHFGGGLPTTGQLIKVEAAANPDGSFTAAKLEPTDANDALKQNIVEYQGVTTSAVGADRVIHFNIGTKSYSFTIGATTDLSDEGGNAQAIQANQLVKVQVQFAGSTGTVLKVEHSNAPGSIQFTGTVRSISSTSTVVSMPDGSTLTMSITSLTDRSHFGGGLPTTGQLIKVEAAANPDGSFTAAKLEPTDANDALKQNIVEYQGVTTSAVGADRVIHFNVGTRSYSFTIGATTDLSDEGGNAQAIQANQLVKVQVQFAGSTGTVLKVEHSNG